METLNAKTKHTRKILLVSMLLVGLSNFYACTDDDDSKTLPIPVPPTSNLFTYQSMDISEFKQISATNEVQEISVTEVEDYFGKRIGLASPKTLELKEDSLYITKPGDLTEGYKIKWENKKLFLYKTPTNTWEYCGERKSDNQVVLNTGFYIKKSKDNSQRLLFVAGQEYALQTYSEIADDETSITWLKANYTFTNTNK